MKTPDVIKKALEICAEGSCYVCPYYRPTGIKCLYELPADAVNYIQGLEARLEQAEQVNARLEIMLNAAQSAAETYKRQLEAAQPQRISVDERMPMPEPPKEQK